MERTELNLYLSQQWKPRGGDLVSHGVLMKEGVHCGSQGCTLHAGDTIRASVANWRQVPVTLNHPHDGTGFTSVSEASDAVIGHLEAPEFRNNSLVADIVITSKDPGVRKTIKACREVSIGLFNDIMQSVGVFNGKAYQTITQLYKPDHLAILTDAPGACSWADGCGIRTNQEEPWSDDDEFVDRLVAIGDKIRAVENHEAEPLLPPGVGKTVEADMGELQREADQLGILLPTEMNRSVAPKKGDAGHNFPGGVEPLLPPGVGGK